MPQVKITSAVIVHTTIVSAKTSKIPHMPCFTALGSSEAACAKTELPSPASFEKTPLATPVRTAWKREYPATPPKADRKENASEKIRLMAAGNLSAWQRIARIDPTK